MTRRLPLSLVLFLSILACRQQPAEKTTELESIQLQIRLNDQENTLSIYRAGESELLVTQNARPDFRPYLHPIAAPDGQGALTEYSPGHHKHQTGLYWGFTRVNGQPVDKKDLMEFFYKKDKTPEQQALAGRDFFHHPEGDHWRRIALNVIDSAGTEVKWQTVYHMLDAEEQPLLEETQTWSMREQNGQFLLSLEWQGKALNEDVTINKFDYGGLFLRMPWREGINGEAVNFARQRNERAEGQRALWVDVGMQVEGRDDLAHIALFDHPENGGFPQPWRVDHQLGVGPCRAILGDWTIPKGETETIRHQLVVYTGELNDLELTEQWKDYVGDDNVYATAALWNIARQEGRDAVFLTPELAVAEMTLKEGFSVNAWAAEPMITQPMAFCWDDRGRLWVAENRDYESRGTGFSNSGDSKILILEDTDGDGQADSRKVFLEGIPFPAAIAVGFDGLFLGAPPNLLFVPDRDRDDRADVDDIEVRLTGWGIRDRHETINSLHWGPDGWLYGLEGFATPSKIRKPKGKGKIYRHKEPFPEGLLEADGIDVNGGVWRYHPVKDRFEVVAHGFSNPWGIDYDARGQLFISACVIPHLFHVIPGGIYHRQGGQHFNPYIYDDIKTIVDHRHRSAHGGARVYLSDAFPAEHQGRLFMANIHEHAVLSDLLEPKGSGFVARHGEDFLMANNAQWIGFSLEIGPEGALYVLDWHDADICGQEVVNKETGRIFRITPKESLAENWPGRYEDLSKMTDEQLAELQLKPSAWHARRARTILQYRATSGPVSTAALNRLRETLEKNEQTDYRLRALWSLHLSQTLTAAELIEILNDEDPYIRAWAVQLLCEDQSPSEAAIRKFEQMAEADSSPVVRLYLAAALQRMPPADRWEIGHGLLSHAEDAGDHNLPKMIWFGIELLVEADLERALKLAADGKIPLIAEYLARRAVASGGTDRVVEAAGKTSGNQIALLTGLRAELETRRDLPKPGNWDRTYNRLRSKNATAQIALEIGQLFGDAEAARALMVTLLNRKAPAADREKALSQLAERNWMELSSQLPVLLDEPVLRIPAIRAVAHFSDRPLGRLLFEKYPDFTPEEKQEAILALASRRTYAEILTNAIKEKKIPRRDIPAYVARQLRRVMGNGFVEIWGPIDEISADVEAAYAQYRKLLTDRGVAAANPAAGKTVFQRTCGACHQMYGEGGKIGPDLTGSNRTNIDYLLTNILEPGAEIQDDYKMVVVTTRGGRTYLGNVAGETERQLTLRIVGQDQVVINKSEIQSREETPNSMMPAGLLNTLTDEEILNLTAYLRTVEK